MNFEVRPLAEVPPPPAAPSRWEDLKQALRTLGEDQAIFVPLQPGGQLKGLAMSLGHALKSTSTERRIDRDRGGVWVLIKRPLGSSASSAAARGANGAASGPGTGKASVTA